MYLEFNGLLPSDQFKIDYKNLTMTIKSCKQSHVFHGIIGGGLEAISPRSVMRLWEQIFVANGGNRGFKKGSYKYF